MLLKYGVLGSILLFVLSSKKKNLYWHFIRVLVRPKGTCVWFLISVSAKNYHLTSK